MIQYNFPYRGSFEYDKFVLNILQLHNEIVMLQGEAFRSTDVDIKKFNELADNYQKLVNDLINSNLFEQLVLYKNKII